MTLRSIGPKQELIKREIRLVTKFLPTKRLNATSTDTQIFKLSLRSTSLKLIL